MNFQDPREQEIIRSWHCNAAAWSEAIRTASIASRKLVTNAAIIDAIRSVAPSTVLDIGCGEGWLARALSTFGMSVTGIDAVPELIAHAPAAGSPPGTILSAEAANVAPEDGVQGSVVLVVQDYASIASRRWRCGPFDAAVCNFSLFVRESVDSLIAALPHYLVDSGHVLIQTLHPVAACGAGPYEDGWREGSWQGFSGNFSDPAPWYFRTLESWRALLERCGFDVLECREPRAAGAGAAASVIWIGKRRGAAQT